MLLGFPICIFWLFANSWISCSSNHFENGLSLTVALWNIDSQDWNSHISAAEAGQRVLNLMLLWRRGVILFHDIHTKAQQAVPWLINNTQQSGIVWDDCRDYK